MSFIRMGGKCKPAKCVYTLNNMPQDKNGVWKYLDGYTAKEPEDFDLDELWG